MHAWAWSVSMDTRYVLLVASGHDGDLCQPTLSAGGIGCLRGFLLQGGGSPPSREHSLIHPLL